MKKTLLAILLALGLILAFAACEDNDSTDERGTNALVTDEEGSVVTDEKGNPETYPPEETDDDTSTGNIQVDGADTTPGYGPLIPIN